MSTEEATATHLGDKNEMSEVDEDTRTESSEGSNTQPQWTANPADSEDEFVDAMEPPSSTSGMLMTFDGAAPPLSGVYEDAVEATIEQVVAALVSTSSKGSGGGRQSTIHEEEEGEDLDDAEDATEAEVVAVVEGIVETTAAVAAEGDASMVESEKVAVPADESAEGEGGNVLEEQEVLNEPEEPVEQDEEVESVSEEYAATKAADTEALEEESIAGKQDEEAQEEVSVQEVIDENQKEYEAHGDATDFAAGGKSSDEEVEQVTESYADDEVVDEEETENEPVDEDPQDKQPNSTVEEEVSIAEVDEAKEAATSTEVVEDDTASIGIEIAAEADIEDVGEEIVVEASAPDDSAEDTAAVESKPPVVVESLATEFTAEECVAEATADEALSLDVTTEKHPGASEEVVEETEATTVEDATEADPVVDNDINVSGAGVSSEAEPESVAEEDAGDAARESEEAAAEDVDEAEGADEEKTAETPAVEADTERIPVGNVEEAIQDDRTAAEEVAKLESSASAVDVVADEQVNEADEDSVEKTNAPLDVEVTVAQVTNELVEAVQAEEAPKGNISKNDKDLVEEEACQLEAGEDADEIAARKSAKEGVEDGLEEKPAVEAATEEVSVDEATETINAHEQDANASPTSRSVPEEDPADNNTEHLEEAAGVAVEQNPAEEMIESALMVKDTADGSRRKSGDDNQQHADVSLLPRLAPSSRTTTTTTIEPFILSSESNEMLEVHLPPQRWTYEVYGFSIEKRVVYYHIHKVDRRTGIREPPILKRYTDFSDLRLNLADTCLRAAMDMPWIPRPHLGTLLRGYKSKKTIEIREKAFRALLRYIVQYPELHGSAVFERFITTSRATTGAGWM